jgi:glycosyltransferase involved in cell wall biosynthesis
VQIVGIALVHNEDVFVEQALRNAAGFCDRFVVADHRSTDGTWEIVQALAAELPHVDAVRISHTGDSHDLIAGYAGTDTWVFGVDGDELYDPEGLARFRRELLGGAYRDLFYLKSNVLNCVRLDRERATASGYLSPPSRSITKLFNFAAFDSWTRCYRQYAHDGDIAFRPGFGETSTVNLGERFSWEESPLRCLHVCFLRRSSLDPPGGAARPSPIELGGKRRLLPPGLARIAERARPRSALPGSAWKEDKYRRGELVTKDAAPFLGTA